jgi:hypothetical protein
MVTEARSLLFTDFELLEALRALMRKRGDSMPGPQPITTRFVDKDNGQRQLVMDFVYDKRSRSFELEDVQSAMIAHCIRQKIPIPRLCMKSIEQRGEYIALIIRLDKKMRETGQRAA